MTLVELNRIGSVCCLSVLSLDLSTHFCYLAKLVITRFPTTFVGTSIFAQPFLLARISASSWLHPADYMHPPVARTIGVYQQRQAAFIRAFLFFLLGFAGLNLPGIQNLWGFQKSLNWISP